MSTENIQNNQVEVLDGKTNDNARGSLNFAEIMQNKAQQSEGMSAEAIDTAHEILPTITISPDKIEENKDLSTAEDIAEKIEETGSLSCADAYLKELAKQQKEEELEELVKEINEQLKKDGSKYQIDLTYTERTVSTRDIVYNADLIMNITVRDYDAKLQDGGKTVSEDFFKGPEPMPQWLRDLEKINRRRSY